MPRRLRYCPAGIPVHVVQRGNNRQVCFTTNADMACYANWLYEASVKYGVKLHAWVLMTNHVHLLMTPSTNEAVSRVLQQVGRRYVRYFNEQQGRSGTLFEGRFKASLVDSVRYLLTCQRYIELNPVRAGMVEDPSDYRWSSYQAHGFGKAVKMWTPHDTYLAMDKDDEVRRSLYRALFSEALGEDLLAEIRLSTQTGFVLGAEKFRAQIEILTGQSQRYVQRGPKVT